MNSEQAPDLSLGAFGLDSRLVDAVTEMGYKEATPIQAAAIPHLLEGHDIVGGARTGSGKTAAFGLPLLHQVDVSKRRVQALVLTPTRELALQVEAAISTYAAHLPVRTLAIYGGAPYAPQLRALDAGVHVVVGTPGRVIDHLERGTLDLSALRMLVLDEGDEMLRMGFIEDVERVLRATPETRQVALFSATMPAAIRRVANKYLRDAVEVQVESGRLTVEHIEQRWVMVPGRHKVDALIRLLMAEPRSAVLVFARTRKRCAEVADLLVKRGVAADALHGDLNQAARERIIGRLRSERLDVVIATDVAARGIDVDHISHVINLDFPQDAETYVHRIGRTGRAGRKGIAISFILPGERRGLVSLERRIKVRLTQTTVPSDAEIALGQRERLKVKLAAALKSTGASHARQWVSELLADEEFSAEDLAVAAVSELADLGGIHFDHVTRTLPPMWARHEGREPRMGGPRDRGPSRDRGPGGSRGHFQDVNQVELHLPLGSNAGVRPADIVGALANELGISGKRIGRVSILAARTFVGVPKEIAELAFSKGAHLVVRGKQVELTLASDRPDHAKRFQKKGFKGGGDKAFVNKGRGKFKNNKRSGGRRKG